MLLDEFKTRHTTLSNKIEETYNIGNEMSNYLEKQMILDYHMRGEQQILEEEHKDLAEKAKKYLGFELYYELSKYNGHPMLADDPLFIKLMEKSNALNKDLESVMVGHIKGKV